MSKLCSQAILSIQQDQYVIGRGQYLELVISLWPILGIETIKIMMLIVMDHGCLKILHSLAA
ncbi:hypothetical protein A6767_21390 [Aeromonas veronii]|nr:hypothetical protein A6767_21390 [Aeromonas veronii]